MADEKYWIWSGQWNAWWRPNSQGYTADRLDAGQYSKEEAERILRGCGPEKQLKMVKVEVEKELLSDLNLPTLEEVGVLESQLKRHGELRVGPVTGEALVRLLKDYISKHPTPKAT